MKDYLKCAIANRFTLLGFITIGGSVILIILRLTGLFSYGPDLLFWLPVSCAITAGGLCELGTQAGRYTIWSYRRTKEHIQTTGGIDSRYSSMYALYCNKVGVAMAAKEAGFSNVYLPSN